MRENRYSGKELKIGLGKVRINGEWKYWEEIERELNNKNKAEEGGREKDKSFT